MTKITGSDRMIEFIITSVTSSLNHTYYSAIADLHNLEFTVAHALGFSVSNSRLLALQTTKKSSCHFLFDHPGTSELN
jgi:hypothetical protein